MCIIILSHSENPGEHLFEVSTSTSEILYNCFILCSFVSKEMNISSDDLAPYNIIITRHKFLQ